MFRDLLFQMMIELLPTLTVGESSVFSSGCAFSMSINSRNNLSYSLSGTEGLSLYNIRNYIDLINHAVH